MVAYAVPDQDPTNIVVLRFPNTQGPPTVVTKFRLPTAERFDSSAVGLGGLGVQTTDLVRFFLIFFFNLLK